MKDLFKSFVAPEQNEISAAWTSDNTIFVFDTNVFLNLYGYEESTREDFFSALESINDRIWIPFQVGLEYHRRRLTIIKNEKKIFRTINSALDNLTSAITTCIQENDIDKKFPDLNNHLSILTESVKSEASKCKKKVSEWDKKQPDVRSPDKILSKLDEYTNGKIGSPPTDQAWLDEIYRLGAIRYASKIPPGYEDEKKSKGDFESSKFTHGGLTYERQFGDLILWNQLIQRLKDQPSDNVIFITDDLKEDWWTIIDSAGDKHIGPHENLKCEIFQKTQTQFFHMYSTADFLRESKAIFKTAISEKSIKDAHNKNETPSTTPHLPHNKFYSANLNSIDLASRLSKNLEIYNLSKVSELLEKTTKFQAPENIKTYMAAVNNLNIPHFEHIEHIREMMLTKKHIDQEIKNNIELMSKRDAIDQYIESISPHDEETELD